MSTQRPARIHEKLERYARAFELAQRDEYPLVVFVCYGEERKRELVHIISQRPEHERPLFRVATVEGFPDDMVSSL